MKGRKMAEASKDLLMEMFMRGISKMGAGRGMVFTLGVIKHFIPEDGRKTRCMGKDFIRTSRISIPCYLTEDNCHDF